MAISNNEISIETELFNRYGPLIGGNDLHQCLGYKSASSFHRACRLGLIKIATFEIDARRGKFALTREVARWLDQVSHQPD